MPIKKSEFLIMITHNKSWLHFPMYDKIDSTKTATNPHN